MSAYAILLLALQVLGIAAAIVAVVAGVAFVFIVLAIRQNFPEDWS